MIQDETLEILQLHEADHTSVVRFRLCCSPANVRERSITETTFLSKVQYPLWFRSRVSCLYYLLVKIELCLSTPRACQYPITQPMQGKAEISKILSRHLAPACHSLKVHSCFCTSFPAHIYYCLFWLHPGEPTLLICENAYAYNLM